MTDNTDHGIRFGRIAAMLGVRDMARAERFYVDLLGFSKVFENGTPTGFMILKRDRAELHLTRAPDYQAPAHNLAHLMVEDAEALFRLLQRHDVRIIKGLRDKDYGLKAFVFADLDGNRIDVGQPL